MHSYADHQDLHSFPTRRSSDLCRSTSSGAMYDGVPRMLPGSVPTAPPVILQIPKSRIFTKSSAVPLSPVTPVARNTRSEEHTSELQSLTNLVCRLLLEKKKTSV